MARNKRLIADAVIDTDTIRAIIARTARVQDSTPAASREGQPASSIAKVHVSEAVARIVNSSVQFGGVSVRVRRPAL